MNELIKNFIHDYNCHIDKINDDLLGIYDFGDDEEEDFFCNKITNFDQVKEENLNEELLESDSE